MARILGLHMVYRVPAKNDKVLSPDRTIIEKKDKTNGKFSISTERKVRLCF